MLFHAGLEYDDVGAIIKLAQAVGLSEDDASRLGREHCPLSNAMLRLLGAMSLAGLVEYDAETGFWRNGQGCVDWLKMRRPPAAVTPGARPEIRVTA